MAKAKTNTISNAEQTPTAAGMPPQFNVKKVVTIPLWKWLDNVQKYVRFDGEIHVGKVVANTIKGKTDIKMEPANVARVTDLSTDRECELIVGSVLKSTLEEEYPGHQYVGKSFQIRQYKIEGKRYRGYEVTEIELF